MRQELGSNQVQGVDYAYTLQGWIKGINSNALDATKDMGHDGSGTGLNGRFARDVASFSLSYYEGDFSSVSSTGAFSSVVGSDLEAQSAELYNGNIRIMQTTLMENNGSGALTASNLGMAYKYDQLNRLKQAKGFTQFTPSTNAWAASSGAAGEHNNFFTFDANGNIVTQQRYEGSTLVDSLTYQYATNSAGHLLSNRLYSVDDSVTVASLSATDMEDMPLYNNATPNTSNNYKYTQIGELKSDAQEEISEIHWRVDSKISEITRTSGSAKKNLKFEYDAMGNRVAKHVYAGSVLESSTYYVRDAQGNVMGVYEHKMDTENAVMEYKLIERNIYGSAQVGICKDTVDLNITNSAGALTQAKYYHARQLNHRQYSLSNHLGNVLTTLGDGKAPVDSNSDGVIDYYVAYIISVSDYSPFGVELASRTWSIEEYRSGFQKQEKDKELWDGAMYYKYRVEDPRLGRFFSVDPLYAKYPYNSNYAFSENVVINAVELEGLEKDDVNKRGYEKMAKRQCEDEHFNNNSDDRNFSNRKTFKEKIITREIKVQHIEKTESLEFPDSEEGETTRYSVILNKNSNFSLYYDMHTVADDFIIQKRGDVKELEKGVNIINTGETKVFSGSKKEIIDITISPHPGDEMKGSTAQVVLVVRQDIVINKVTEKIFGFIPFSTEYNRVIDINRIPKDNKVIDGVRFYRGFKRESPGYSIFKSSFDLKNSGYNYRVDLKSKVP